MEPRPRVIASTPAWSIAAYRNVLVNVWRTEVQLEGIRAIEEAITELFGTGRVAHYGSVTVIESTLSMRITEEARNESTLLQARWKDKMKCSAYVVEDSTFMLAGVRTLTAGMSLMTRSPFPIRTFADSPAAADWVAQQMDVDSWSVLNTMNQARSGSIL
ncbi:MAG: hypothetical protein AB7S26_13205 [Sandaracinaceae bacterium]